MSNFALVFIVIIGVIIGAFVVVGLLGRFLLGFGLALLFLIAVAATRGYGMSGTSIIAGLLIFFVLGTGLQFVTGSTIQTTYESAIALDSVSLGVSDSTFSAFLGFGAIIVVVALAMLGLFMSARRRR
jgi:hypothetical protein